MEDNDYIISESYSSFHTRPRDVPHRGTLSDSPSSLQANASAKNLSFFTTFSVKRSQGNGLSRRETFPSAPPSPTPKLGTSVMNYEYNMLSPQVCHNFSLVQSSTS